MENEFKQVDEKLGFEEEKEEIVETTKKEEIQVEVSEFHDTEIKNDYQKIRKDIINSINTINSAVEIIEESMKVADERFLARQAEVIGTLMKVGVDIRKELMNLHKSRQELLYQEEDEDKPEGKVITLKDVKSKIKGEMF